MDFTSCFFSLTISRINHVPFDYVISLKNPRGSRKRVIVRLFLGLAYDKADLR